ITKLARVWLSRGYSTAFQERVFSTSSLRTHTDNEHVQRLLILCRNRKELQHMEAC
ncbi:hypothetical protein PHMEG_00012454, partial [Phytophthora megakarya]